MKVILILLFFLCINPVSADINITIQSENSKDASILALNQSNMGNISNNEKITLPYDNYIVRIVANTSNINEVNLLGFTNGLAGKAITLLIIIILVLGIIYFMRSKW